MLCKEGVNPSSSSVYVGRTCPVEASGTLSLSVEVRGEEREKRREKDSVQKT